MKNLKLFLWCFVIVGLQTSVAQNNAKNSKTISGYVTSEAGPLSQVNIIIENHLNGTKTQTNGYYELEASVGDILHFTHLGYHKVSIVIEDITEILNIRMQLASNELGTAVVKARKKVKSYNEIVQEKRTATIMTGVGKLDLKAIAQKVDYIDGKTLNLAAPTFQDAIRGKFTGTLPQIWDIDGFIFELRPDVQEPYIDVSSIEDIYILSGVAGTARWGGPVMIIKTSMSNNAVAAKKEETAESFRNQNFYQDDAVSIDTSEEITFDNSVLKTISGTITFEKLPVANVHVTSLFGQEKVITDTEGNYSIEVAVGDELKFSHVSYATVYVIVEDSTEVLDFSLSIKSNELEEVYLENKIVKSSVQEQDDKAQQKFTTARGTVDPAKSGTMTHHIEGSEVFALGHGSLLRALVGKISGYGFAEGKPYLRGAGMSINNPQPAIWDVDGQIYTDEPPILPSEIKDIYVLKTLAAVVKYGNIANGGVIVIKTTYGDFSERVKKQDPSIAKLQNNNFYANDAVTMNGADVRTQLFIQALRGMSNEDEAIQYYYSEQLDEGNDPHFKIALAQKALHLFDYQNLARVIINEVAIKYANHPEILKALAYQYQAHGLKKEAISMYERVYKLRPNYAQSYRDLSNAYIENEQFKRGWRLYLSYIFQGHALNDEGIGEILYNEMEWIYFNRNNQTDIRELFLPKNESVNDFRDDVRVVVEWNTSEAEFDLEFVSPEKRAYVFEHTHVGAQDLITKEKKKGYSSKQFFVDDLEEGDWLFNVTYYGNKKPAPTYLKVTSYYNWGLPHQTTKINVYTLDKTNTKFQLLKYNKNNLTNPNQVIAQK